MTKLDIIKGGVGMIVGIGVNKIISNIVDANVPQTNTIQKVVVFAGKTGISILVGDLVKDHVNQKIDEAAVWAAENVQTA